MQKLLYLTLVLDRLGREEQQLKQLGAHAQAAGVRASIVAILKLAGESEPSLDASDAP